MPTDGKAFELRTMAKNTASLSTPLRTACSWKHEHTDQSASDIEATSGYGHRAAGKHLDPSVQGRIPGRQFQGPEGMSSERLFATTLY